MKFNNLITIITIKVKVKVTAKVTVKVAVKVAVHMLFLLLKFLLSVLTNGVMLQIMNGQPQTFYLKMPLITLIKML